LTLWYYRPEQRPCLQLAYGMDRHRQTMIAEGWRRRVSGERGRSGVRDGVRRALELLSAADDPPRGGDVLAGLWMVHWSDAAGRIWKGHIIEGRRPGIPGHPHMQAATWGRAIYHPTGNLTGPR
jgi:hypothetical protein